jgi:hypothetical protein
VRADSVVLIVRPSLVQSGLAAVRTVLVLVLGQESLFWCPLVVLVMSWSSGCGLSESVNCHRAEAITGARDYSRKGHGARLRVRIHSDGAIYNRIYVD